MQLKRAGTEKRMNLSGWVVKQAGNLRVGVVQITAQGFHLVPVSS